jgi:hypothetical protein
MKRSTADRPADTGPHSQGAIRRALCRRRRAHRSPSSGRIAFCVGTADSSAGAVL